MPLVELLRSVDACHVPTREQLIERAVRVPVICGNAHLASVKAQAAAFVLGETVEAFRVTARWMDAMRSSGRSAPDRTDLVAVV
jgi:hypothetical protein